MRSELEREDDIVSASFGNIVPTPGLEVFASGLRRRAPGT